MKLSREDVDLFYRLMWGLQFFVNCEKKIVSDITSLAAYEETSTEEKTKVRAALYERPQLIDAFIWKNRHASYPPKSS
ncbi:MAG: hypothetical protein WGN25_08210 [Candidatus Electrothrix sp. GW3-4]|uniref:hypothetical protein n=1 Tax=Candidatus Electrothrix sp. GW3-4 TaxID=3126740 RepID=UPI0030D59B58